MSGCEIPLAEIGQYAIQIILIRKKNWQQNFGAKNRQIFFNYIFIETGGGGQVGGWSEPSEPLWIHHWEHDWCFFGERFFYSY